MRELVEWLGAGTDIHPVLSMADPRAWAASGPGCTSPAARRPARTGSGRGTRQERCCTGREGGQGEGSGERLETDLAA
jgi:hypothetical protein